VLRPEIASHLGVVRFFNEVKVTAKSIIRTFSL
jgi:hypothetical protein